MILLFKKEKRIITNIMDINDDELTPANVYKRIFAVLKLPSIRRLIAVLFFNRVFFIIFEFVGISSEFRGFCEFYKHFGR